MADCTLLNVIICSLTFRRPSLLKSTHFRLAFRCWRHHRFLFKSSISVKVLLAKYTVTFTLLLVSHPKQSDQLGYSTAPQNKLCLPSSLRCPDIFPLAYSTYVAACIRNSRCFSAASLSPHGTSFKCLLLF